MFNANYKKKTTYFRKWLIFCDLGGARTLGPLIKSQLLFSGIKSCAFDATSELRSLLAISFLFRFNSWFNLSSKRK